MADKNLEVSLKIKAEAKQATAEVAGFNAEVEDISTSANTASAATTQLATNVENTSKKFVYAGQSVFSLRDAVQQSDSAAKQLTTTTAVVAAETERAAQKFVYAGRSTFSLRDGMKAATQSSKEQATELARLLSTYDAANAYTQRLVRDEAALKKAFDEGRVSATQYQRSIVELQRRNQMLSSSYGTLRGSMSNVGYQFQDIAVQMQMGVNPFVIFSQQGSQLVSSFNPLAGAIIAVGGAIAGALLPSFFSAGKATEELTSKIEDLNEGYITLTESQRQFLRDQEQTKQDALREDIKKTQEEIQTLTRRYDELTAAKNGAAKPAAAGSTMGVGFGAGTGSIQGADEKAAKALTEARAALDTKNQELIESDKEMRRINGEKVIDDQELIKQTNELIESLEKETSAYGLTGEALGKHIADELKATGTTRDRIIELYRKRDAQKEATKAEREAEADADKATNKAKSRQEAAVEYVRNLERQAAAIGKTAQEVSDAEFAYRGLTGELLKQAQAAQAAIQADKDRQALAELNIQLLRAQGKEQEATQLEFEKRYGDMLKRLEASGDKAGTEIVKSIINLKALDTQLAAAEAKIDKSLNDIARQETSIQTQREAGLISEYEARQKIYELHQAQAEKLRELRPVLDSLKDAPGQVGESAREAIAALDEEILRLESTLTLLQSTLREGLETGLTDAILGLADGTMTLRDAVNSLVRSVAEALAQMAAQALAQKAVAALFSLGGSKDSGEAMKEGATATTAAAGALMFAATQWQVTAAQIQAAAASLAAAGGSGGGNSSGGSSNWAATAFQAFASFYAADGGHITGPGTATSDSIPAMLSNNEYVTRAAVVGQPGALGFLEDFNARGMAALRDWAPARHNTGGMAGAPAPARSSPMMGNASLPQPAAAFSATVPLTQHINLIDDPARMAEAINTPAGEQNLMIVMKKDPAKYRAILGVNN